MQHHGRHRQCFAVSLISINQQIERDSPFDALDTLQPAIMGNICRLGRPGRDGSTARRYNQQSMIIEMGVIGFPPIGQYLLQNLQLLW